MNMGLELEIERGLVMKMSVNKALHIMHRPLAIPLVGSWQAV